jgi:NitT/TauT family transport system substrate-binding protein
MRLTPLAKAICTLVVLGAVGAVVYKNRDQVSALVSSAKGGAAGAAGGVSATPGGSASPTPAGAPGSAPRRRIVVGVNDFGGAYPALVANDGATPGPASLFTQAGLDVEIKLVRGSKERLDQFDAGGIDIMLLTLDYVANLYADYQAKKTDVKTFFFVDWSRGNLGIVAKPKFTSIESLKDARIATTRNTPTHYFLLTLLDRSNLKPNEIEITKQSLMFAKKTPLAGEMFQRGEADAVAIWEPHLSQAEKSGGRLLVSTTTASNLIADVLFARETFLTEHAADMPAFLRAWLAGVAKLAADREGSVAVISRAFAQTPDETRAVLGKIKPATYGDNRAFFGLETETSPYASLFNEAARIWVREGVIKAAPEARQAVRTSYLESLASEHKNETVVENFKFDASKGRGDALLTKSVSIYFASGSADLDPNARKIIDGFAEQLVGIFQNAYVRVEGNTDAVGGRAANKTLSEKRARGVVAYLVSRHRFDPGRFVAVGNGPDRPVADNNTTQGRDFNRRTDFRIVPNY